MCCDKVAIEYVNGMFVLNILFGFKFDVNSVLNFFLCVLVVMYFPLTTNYLYFWCFPTVEDFSITPCFFSWLFFFIHFFFCIFLLYEDFFFHSMVLSMIITLFIVFSYCMRIFFITPWFFHDYFFFIFVFSWFFFYYLYSIFSVVSFFFPFLFCVQFAR